MVSLFFVGANQVTVDEVKKKPKRECLHDKAMCSPHGEEYLSWKRKMIEQAEAATNGHKSKKQKTKQYIPVPFLAPALLNQRACV